MGYARRMAKRPRSRTAKATEFTYLYDDRRLTVDDLTSFQVVVAGEELTRDPGVIRVFADNTQFAKWIGDTEQGARVRGILDVVKRGVPRARRDEAWIEEIQRLAFKTARSTLQGFAKTLERDVKDEEVIRLAMVERGPLTPKVFDPMLLYDRRIEREPPTGAPEDPRTSWLPVWSGFWPDLGWPGWNDRARSARVFGLNILCENTWFGGRWAWLIGFNMLLNLYHLNFEAKASSVISQ